MIGMYRTDAPEKCIRALLERHRRVWVNTTFETKGKISLQRAYLNDLPIYPEARLPLGVWEKYGGIVLQSSRRPAMPPTPALLLLECPLSERALGILALPAREALVVRVPQTWRLHEMILAQRHPGKYACGEFYEWLQGQSQRMSDDAVAIMKELGHEVSDTVAVSAEQSANFDHIGRALEIMPDISPSHCSPIKLVREPYTNAPFWPTWRIIEERAPDVNGWRIVSDKLFDDNHLPWGSHIALMRRLGLVHSAPILSFLSTRKAPQFDAAEAKLQSALSQLQSTIKLVAGWPMYPIEGVHGPVKPRRTRSPKRLAALKAAGLLPDTSG